MLQDEPLFPCKQMPEEPRIARLLGLYDQRQPGLLMQRVKVHGGAITPAQLRAMADAAERFTPQYPLHLTTRQDIEFHGLRPEDIPAIQQVIAGAGLTTLGACGDTLRNVTTCYGNGLCPGTFDVSAVASAVRDAAESFPSIRKLPRKFKICISGCLKACSKPFINDLAFIAQDDGSFQCIIAGSLGPHPSTGIELPGRYGSTDLVPLNIAALTLFNAEGDRTNRGRARLRHVRERLGNEVFITRVIALFQTEKNGNWPKPAAPRVPDPMRHVVRLALPLGDFTPEMAREIANTGDRSGTALRIGIEHDIYVYSDALLELAPRLIALARRPRIVACPGTTWCHRGITDSREAAEKIAGVLPDDSPLLICINGCPNNCGHAPIADIGLIGRIKTVDGVRTECFRVAAGGGKGASRFLAHELHAEVPSQFIGLIVKRLASELAARSTTGNLHENVQEEKNRLSNMIGELISNGKSI